MLTVVSGRFHPGLEQAFIDRIQELKKDPLTPVLVVAPSSRQIDRLQLALAQENISTINAHFHTFTSLAESIVNEDGPLDKPVLSDPLFYDTLIKKIIREDKPFEVFEDLAVPDGFPPSARGTLRDLLDAGIDQQNVETLVLEGFAGDDVDLGTLRSLLKLHGIYLHKISKLNVAPRFELVKKAIKLTPKSKFLSQFHEILYYGFYDLTGLQTDFFQEVVKNFPSHFYFPYVRDDASYQFAKRFRDVFVQGVMKDEIVLETEKWKSEVKIRNVSGQRDEAWFVAGEIRRLHDEKGVPFSEMAVVARTKDRLGFFMQEALADRGIPCRPAAHPHLFDFPPVQQSWHELNQQTPEGPSTWENYISVAAQFIKAQSIEELLKKKMLDGVELLERFELIEKKISWENFLDVLKDRWSLIEVRDGTSAEAGVQLLYAEAARGLAFNTVFLIGLEEKVFPRVVREDPFLRDAAREALNGIGHKISQKLTALEEERLLFELITASAAKNLFIVYQRSDDAGSIVGSSPFLRAFKHDNNIQEDVSIPRSLIEKLQEAKPQSLGFTDVMVGFLAARENARTLSLAKDLGRDDRGLKAGLELQKAVNQFDRPGPYDGMVGPLGTADIFRSGKISASNLENYSACGFKFFASEILGLEPLEKEELEEKLAADLRGRLVHKFAETFFRRVTSEGTAGIPEKFPRAIFESTFEEILPVTAPEEVRLPLVLWESTRDSLRSVLSSFMEREFAYLKNSGAVPTFMETVVEGPLPPPLDKFKWKGKIDRIDLIGGTAEVLDYKTGKPFDVKSVSKLALKAEKMQAPIYMELAQDFLARSGKAVSALSFRYEFIDHEGQARLLSAEEWAGASQGILVAMKALIDAAHLGQFIMKPDFNCKFCEVARICRNRHGISIYRNRQSLEPAHE